jgi:hypothetical protein
LLLPGTTANEIASEGRAWRFISIEVIVHKRLCTFWQPCNVGHLSDDEWFNDDGDLARVSGGVLKYRSDLLQSSPMGSFSNEIGLSTVFPLLYDRFRTGQQKSKERSSGFELPGDF